LQSPPRVGGGSAFFVKQHEYANVSVIEIPDGGAWVIRHVFGGSNLFEHSKAKI
jgi:hypothetical protein